MRKRKVRKKLKHLRNKAPTSPKIDDVWSFDFVHDRMADNKRLKFLTSIDHCTRESPIMYAAQSIRGTDVVALLEDQRLQNRKPKTLVLDNGPEFRSRALRVWATIHKVQIHFIEPGKPTQNAFIESFNGKFRSECLDSNLFETLDSARALASAWKRKYEFERPHSSLGGIPPKAYRAKLEKIALTPGLV